MIIDKSVAEYVLGPNDSAVYQLQKCNIKSNVKIVVIKEKNPAYKYDCGYYRI